jgi:hypothetical protein
MLDQVYSDIKETITQILLDLKVTKFSLVPYSSSINWLALRKDESDLDLSLVIPGKKLRSRLVISAKWSYSILY